jgi:hypothetical protein
LSEVALIDEVALNIIECDSIIVASMPACHFLRVRARSFGNRKGSILRHAGIPGFGGTFKTVQTDRGHCCIVLQKDES